MMAIKNLDLAKRNLIKSIFKNFKNPEKEYFVTPALSKTMMEIKLIGPIKIKLEMTKKK